MTLLLSSAVPIEETARPVPFPDVPFTRVHLANGLTLIVHEDRSAPLVASQLRFNVGSKDEPLGRFGFAHLFEHLMFRESAQRPGSWHDALAALGGSNVNGSTSYDYTNYYQTVPTGALDTLLWMEADRMGHLLDGLNAEALASEVEVVKNEKRQREGAPLGLVPEAIAGILYPVGHPYGHTVLGTFSDLDRATLDTVDDWYHRWYGAGNAILVLAGDISPSEALAKVERWFGGLRRGAPIRRATRWLPPRQGAQRLFVEESVAHDGVVKVWSVPARGAPDTVDLGLLAAALTGAPDAALSRRLVYDENLCTAVQASVEARYLCSEFCISATFSPGADGKRVEAIIDDELARLLETGPTGSRMEESLRGERLGFIGSTEALWAKAELLASSEMALGTPDGYRELEAFAAAATPARVAAAGRRWLTADALTIDVRSLVQAASIAAAPPRAPVPVPGPVTVQRFPQTGHATLSNGITVRLARRPGSATVSTLLLIDGGMAGDPIGAEGLTSFTLTQMEAGTAAYDLQAIAARQRHLSSQITTGADLETVSVSCRTLLDTYPEAIRLFAEVARSPAYAEAEFERAQVRALAALDHRSPTAGQQAARAAAVLGFGPRHRLGRRLSGTRDGIARLTSSDLVARHAALFKPSAATLFVVGDLTIDAALGPLEAAFGDWQASAAAVLPNEDIFAPRPGRYLIARGAAPQSAIHVNFATPALSRAHDIGTVIGVFGHIFGETFGSRLNRALREKRGWTYGAQCGFARWDGIGNFNMTTEVQANRTIDAIDVIGAELRDLIGDRPITIEELDGAKSALLLQSAGFWINDTSILTAMVESHRRALPADHFDRFGERLAAVSMTDVGAISALVADPGAMSIVVAGDPRAFNATSLRSIDAEGNDA